MLTGDKIETAINIGKNCSLVGKKSSQVVLDEENEVLPNLKEA